MATITSDTYLDSASRSAGEAMTISSGATLTIRTDSRMHANAPASMTGSMSSVDFTDIGGTYSIDATAVRWLAYNSGSGSLPAIGTSITQGAVSGYFLGIWETYGSAPATSTVPATGYIKLREVTGGTYTSGALGGITASATGADVTGWIELVYDAGTNFTVPRVGKFKSRGAWFELGTTNGSVAQQLTVPSTSSALTNNYLPGVWVETASGSGSYEFWTGLSSAANGWAKQHIGQPRGATDGRVKFVKTFGSGIVQFGEDVDVNGTYAEVAGQAGTYSNATISSTYVWADDVMTVTTGTTAHLLETGMQAGLQVTTGSGTTGIYTVTVIDTYRFTVPLTGSGTGGDVTLRAGVSISFTAHGMLEGESVYCDFTSGSGVDGTYTIWRRTNANGYVINYPRTSALSTGNVTCRHTVTISSTAHGLAVGNIVKLDCTSGSGTDGTYTIKSVATDTFTVNMPHSEAISGNVTAQFTLGHVPVTGCKVRIPNIFIAECATASRATNSVPNSTIASRPQITTTAAGDLDLEYLYALSLYTGVVGQSYKLRLYHCAFQDALVVSEIASALDLDDVGVGMYSAQDLVPVSFTSCFAGGTVKNVVAQRGNTPNTTDHSYNMSYCSGVTVTNLKSGVIQFVRSSGAGCQITTCQNLTFNGVQVFNGNVIINSSVIIEINDLDYNDRYIGRTNATTGIYGVNIGVGCDGIKVDGYSTGLYNTIQDCHPYSGLVTAQGMTDLVVRNIGTYASPVSLGTWAVDTYGAAYAIYFPGNLIGARVQKIYTTRPRTHAFFTINSNKDILYDRFFTTYPYINSGTGTPRTTYTSLVADLNCDVRGMMTGAYQTTGQTSCYGTHFLDCFLGTGSGAIILAMNEPTTATSSYVTVNSGANVKFNSSGGIEMRSVGDQVTWEMSYFSEGHTSFANIAPVMSGGTSTDYTLEYQIDVNNGSGYNGTWLTLNTTNLTTHSLTLGFKLKIRITTGTNNTNAITFLRIYTNTSSTAQSNIAYPLDVATYTVTVLDIVTGLPLQNARVYITADSGGALPSQASVTITRSSSTATVSHTGHSLSTSDKVLISGANQPEYNGIKTITYISDNSYSYTVSGTPDTPATGTITATAVIMNTTTNASGIATDTISLTADQPVEGHVRLSSGSTFYKTAPILGTIDTVTGLSLTVQLIPDV